MFYDHRRNKWSSNFEFICKIIAKLFIKNVLCSTDQYLNKVFLYVIYNEKLEQVANYTSTSYFMEIMHFYIISYDDLRGRQWDRNPMASQSQFRIFGIRMGIGIDVSKFWDEEQDYEFRTKSREIPKEVIEILLSMKFYIQELNNQN